MRSPVDAPFQRLKHSDLGEPAPTGPGSATPQLSASDSAVVVSTPKPNAVRPTALPCSTQMISVRAKYSDTSRRFECCASVVTCEMSTSHLFGRGSTPSTLLSDCWASYPTSPLSTSPLLVGCCPEPIGRSRRSVDNDSPTGGRVHLGGSCSARLAVSASTIRTLAGDSDDTRFRRRQGDL